MSADIFCDFSRLLAYWRTVNRLYQEWAVMEEVETEDLLVSV
jgi:hypothetical protein